MYHNLGKIVATIGPASNSPEVLEKLFLNGVNVFRLNFSHGSHEDHAEVYRAIRLIGRKHGAYPSILADLQGPKLRIGTFENGKITVNKGDVLKFDLDPTPGNQTRVCVPHREILDVVEIDSVVLIDDGKIRVRVAKRCDTHVEVEVIDGGVLSNRKGVNVPDVVLPIPALTKKDIEDLEFAVELGVDWIALSFVQSVRDVEEARNLIDGRAGIISKIEKPSAIDCIEQIVDASDGIMFARGDLGVELPAEQLPVLQRRVVDICRKFGKPVIVATQMLESMIGCPTATRAEVSDIATAVYLSADATMLSAETASGSYPIESVQTMKKVVNYTESSYDCCRVVENDSSKPICTCDDAFAFSVFHLSKISGAKAIVIFSDSFEFLLRCARTRPFVEIIFVTSNVELAYKAGLIRCVRSVLSKKFITLQEAESFILEYSREKKLFIKGDILSIVFDDEKRILTNSKI